MADSYAWKIWRPPKRMDSCLLPYREHHTRSFPPRLLLAPPHSNAGDKVHEELLIFVPRRLVQLISVFDYRFVIFIAAIALAYTCS